MHSIKSYSGNTKKGVCILCGPVRIIKVEGEWECREHYEETHKERLELETLLTKKTKALKFKGDRLSANFNLSWYDYLSLMESQDFSCAICGAPFSASSDAQVDHDHSCCPEAGKSCGGCIRGLLCPRCNMGIGYFQDDAERLLRARTYLLDTGGAPR